LKCLIISVIASVAFNGIKMSVILFVKVEGEGLISIIVALCFFASNGSEAAG
jgi:hypothetical protein